jgi:hypothetical protein
MIYVLKLKILEFNDYAFITLCTNFMSVRRFNRIAWGTLADQSKPYGILAGGMKNGELGLWNPKSIIGGNADALLVKKAKHSGPVKGLDFNPFNPLLASGATNGEVLIYICHHSIISNIESLE